MIKVNIGFGKKILTIALAVLFFTAFTAGGCECGGYLRTGRRESDDTAGGE